MSSESGEQTLYTVEQQKVLVLAPVLSSILSILGSTIIFTIIVRDWKNKVAHTYHRILFALSTIDLVSSVNLAFAGLAVPKGVFWGAAGNVTTCNISGFLAELSSASQLYNVGLVVYYLLVIRFKVSQAYIQRYVEPSIHLIAISKPFAMGIATFSVEGFNPLYIAGGWCHIIDYPARCSISDDVDCQRGGLASRILAILSVGVSNLIAFIVMGVSLIVIVLYIRSDLTSIILDNSSSSNLGPSGNRTRQTSIQACLYILSSFLTYFTAMIALFNQKENYRSTTGVFVLSLLIKIFLPLQGFFNCLIYVRPQFVVMKLKSKRHGHELLSFSKFLFQLIFPPGPNAVHFAPELVPEAAKCDDDGDDSKEQSDIIKNNKAYIESYLRPAPSTGGTCMPYIYKNTNTNGEEWTKAEEPRPITSQLFAIVEQSQHNNNNNNNNRIESGTSAEIVYLEDNSIFENKDDDEETARLRKIFFSY